MLISSLKSNGRTLEIQESLLSFPKDGDGEKELVTSV